MLGDSLSCQKALLKFETLFVIGSKRQQALEMSRLVDHFGNGQVVIAVFTFFPGHHMLPGSVSWVQTLLVTSSVIWGPLLNPQVSSSLQPAYK